ncbi:MAG: alanine racemase [Enterobacter hormaechei]
MKLDTGMHRLGVAGKPKRFISGCASAKRRQPVNIVSHFARADEPECGATETA